MRDRFDVAFACDPDADRHGIVTPSAGLLNPNHYLAVCDRLPVRRRARLAGEDAGIGKTLVSSSMIDRVAERPRPARWSRCRSASSGSSTGLLDGSLGFGGEESAGASFLRRDGTPWSTDKDGYPVPAGGRDHGHDRQRPGRALRSELTERFGAPAYKRVDSPVDAEREGEAAQARRPRTSPRPSSRASRSSAVLTKAPGNDAPIGGVKVVAEHGWFAARPSGTEDIYKLYAESFKGEEHLEQIIDEAQEILGMSTRS